MTAPRVSEAAANAQFNKIKKALALNIAIHHEAKRPANGWVYRLFIVRENGSEWIGPFGSKDLATPADLLKLVGTEFSSIRLWITHMSIPHDSLHHSCSFDVTSVVRGLLARRADRSIKLYS